MAELPSQPEHDSPCDPRYTKARNETLSTISREDVRELIRQGQRPGQRFVLVDLRRSDHTGGTIRGSINLPAETLYPSLPTLYEMFASANVRSVIWYCGGSKHRGLRAAARMDDYIKGQGNLEMKSFVLVGGVKGWANAGAEYTKLMDEFDKESWN